MNLDENLIVPDYPEPIEDLMTAQILKRATIASSKRMQEFEINVVLRSEDEVDEFVGMHIVKASDHYDAIDRFADWMDDCQPAIIGDAIIVKGSKSGIRVCYQYQFHKHTTNKDLATMSNYSVNGRWVDTTNHYRNVLLDLDEIIILRKIARKKEEDANASGGLDVS